MRTIITLYLSLALQIQCKHNLKRRARLRVINGRKRPTEIKPIMSLSPKAPQRRQVDMGQVQVLSS